MSFQDLTTLSNKMGSRFLRVRRQGGVQIPGGWPWTIAAAFPLKPGRWRLRHKQDDILGPWPMELLSWDQWGQTLKGVRGQRAPLFGC